VIVPKAERLTTNLEGVGWDPRVETGADECNHGG